METTIFTPRDRRRLERAADHYLRACYRSGTAARVTEFAAVLDLTQPYLSRFVAAITGLPVRDYLRQRQLAYAAYLLQATPLSVRQIAIASAFGAPSTFYRCFQAAYDKTPAVYRREVMKCDTATKIAPVGAIAQFSFDEVMKCE